MVRFQFSWLMPIAGVVYPAAEQHVNALNRVLPVIGLQWQYSATGILAGVILLGVRAIAKPSRRTRGRFAGWGIVLVLVALVLIVPYGRLATLAEVDEAPWVSTAVLGLYFGVIATANIGTMWIEQSAKITERPMGGS